MALFRDFFGAESASDATFGQSSAAPITEVVSTPKHCGNFAYRTFRSSASSLITAFEKGIGSQSPTDGQRMSGQMRWFFRVASYPTTSDCPCGGWRGQRQTWMEMDTTGHVRLLAGFASPATSAYSLQALALSVWYQIILNFTIDRAGGDDTASTTLEVRDPGGVVVASITLPDGIVGVFATYGIDGIFVGHLAGGVSAAYDFYHDDIVFCLGTDGDEPSVALPAGKCIFAFLPSSNVINQFTGTFADVDEVPMSGADFQEGDNGEDVTYQKPSAGAAGADGLDAIKIIVNATSTAANTHAILIDGVEFPVTLSTTTGSDDGNTANVIDWTPRTNAQFDAITVGLRNKVAGQVVRINNFLVEGMGEEVSNAGAPGISLGSSSGLGASPGFGSALFGQHVSHLGS